MQIQITWTYTVSNRPRAQRLELNTLVPQEMNAEEARVKIIECFADKLEQIQVDGERPRMTIGRTGRTTHQFYSIMDFPLNIPLHRILDSVQRVINSEGMVFHR